MTTQLYLISPPRIDLTTFIRSLEDAFSINRSPQGDNQKFVGAFQLRLKDTDDAPALARREAGNPAASEHMDKWVTLCVTHIPTAIT